MHPIHIDPCVAYTYTHASIHKHTLPHTHMPVHIHLCMYQCVSVSASFCVRLTAITAVPVESTRTRFFKKFPGLAVTLSHQSGEGEESMAECGKNINMRAYCDNMHIIGIMWLYFISLCVCIFSRCTVHEVT